MESMYQYIAGWSVAALVVVGCRSAEGQCLRYSVDVIQPPRCQFFYPTIGVTAISEIGELAGGGGTCSGPNSAFAWYGSMPLSYLPMPSGMSGEPTGINSSRQIVGSMIHISGSGGFRAFLYQNGSVTDLGTLAAGTGSEAYAIDENGVVCGYSQNAGPKAVVWQSGQTVALDLPLGPNSVANDISDNGLVCGWMGDGPSIFPDSIARAFIHDTFSGRTIDIGIPLPEIINAQSTGVNSFGNVCGFGFESCNPTCGGRRGFYWSSGTAQDIGNLPGYPRCLPMDLNDSNIVVGYCATQSLVSRAFVWQHGVIRDLNALVPGELNLNITNATAINNAGQIAAYGILNNGPYVALRLNPIPPIYGDITCDWVVNHLDLMEVINNWGPVLPSVPNAPTDITGDGAVNVSDLLAVINHWTF